MKADKASLTRSLAQPDPAIRFYLFHGPDEAGSRALAIKLLRGLGDAEKFVVLGQSVKSDPASLADEAGAMALFGGKRAIWIEPAGDEIVDGVQALLDLPSSESAVVALAGVLKKSSALLKLAESHRGAWSHVSWVPEGREAAATVVELCRALGLRIAPDVATRVAASAANNQAIAASEVEKFALYLGASPEHPVELDHKAIDGVGADSAEAEPMKFGDLALSGDIAPLLDELGRLPEQGGDAVAALRALERRLVQIAPLRARVEAGERVDGVMASMGKALFWKDKSAMQRMLSRWTSAQIAEAAERVTEAEREGFRGRAPDRALLAETLVTIARAASRAR